MERSFARELESLESIHAFVEEFARLHQVDDAAVFAATLAIEELFVNMVTHRREGARKIVLSLERRANDLVITLTDFDVDSFDVTQAAPLDLDRWLAAGRGGGLGLHLVRSVMDRIDYDYHDRVSRITLTKHLEKRDVID